jgi:glutamine amidotransferase
MIGVVAYGVGNIGSILSMLRKIGVPAAGAATAAEVERAEKIILPGVGSFDHAMNMLAQRGLVQPLKDRISRDGVPVLGICLGMQMLGRGSEEGALGGLDLLDARCARLRTDGESQLKVPHMGWSELTVKRESPLLSGLDAHARFYFVHSYHLVCRDPGDVLATARYGMEFTAMVQRGNMWGAQFHPEKSHRFGMKLLGNFAGL